MTQAATSGWQPGIGRGFVELPQAQIHYRHAGRDGARRPLVLVHASPASSAGLVPLMAAMATDRRVIAPDTLGNGDSVGPIPEGADVPFFAGRLLQALDALGLQRFDLYGTHTGASIATELALVHPERVGALVLDGVGLYPPDFQRELLERYAPALKLDHQAGYLMWVWHFVRDTFMYWPWYRLDREHRRDNALPAPEVLHAKVVEVLKAAQTYHHSYRAAMAYDKRSRMPLLQVPTLAACARSDMLHIYFDELCTLVPGGRGAWLEGIHTPEAAAATAAQLRQFFDAVAD
ncbi:alpha/beta hydrolase [Ramlibacter sp. G-1-2-2]|uniref:Alpha/beta hydrolase n=1 Tax=Ramlibacter agri TaxID=2728837 RepID=A0A848H5F4_9BURK|nr:alpha/beta hydrolase [Ramlibacter agri]NML44749.1 alpha/beta hydrolase [Ramlibacter agri]